MPTDLYRLIAQALTPSAVGLLARNLGETPGAARKALDGAIGAALQSALLKTASPAGAEEVLSVLAESRDANAGLLVTSPPGFETRLRRAAPDDPLMKSTAAVDRLFSGRAPGLVDHLASFAKVKRESAAALLRLGTSLALASLDEATGASGGAAGLRRALRGQQAEIGRIMPRGFDPDLGGRPSAAGEGPRWLPWLLAAALVLMTLVALRNCSRDEPGAEVVTVPPASDGAFTQAPPEPGVGGAQSP